MPQMAPIMWLPLFTLITLLMHLMKSTLYFIKSTAPTKSTHSEDSLSANWLW